MHRIANRLTRRGLLGFGTAGLFGLGINDLLALRAAAAPAARPKSAIVLFCWGGISHLDTFDPKPDAGTEIRGEFHPIQTNVPGIQLSEHLPGLAQRADKLAVIRSMHHKSADHRAAAYWNLTGHTPPGLEDNGVVGAVPPSRQDWPTIGSMVARARDAGAMHARRPGNSALPGTVSLPYPMADRGLLYGQYGGFLGVGYDPVFMTPGAGRPYDGVSPQTGTLRLEPVDGVSRDRITQRQALLRRMEANQTPVRATTAGEVDQYRTRAFDMLLAPQVRSAFDLEQEPAALRERYGGHVCGQSTLLARRLVEAGVPLVTVCCAAGDLNGSAGSHFDTHGDNFNRLKRDMLPPLDQAGSALLDDLSDRGMLDDTLVVWMSEFGRTPQIRNAGRDHFPNCYSAVLAGGGVQGGQIYGRSNATGSMPVERPCGPADLHATIFKALGIDPKFQLRDLENRPLALCDGQPLPLF